MTDGATEPADMGAGLDQRPLIRGARFLSDRWPQLLSIIGTIGIAAVSLLLDKQPQPSTTPEAWWHSHEGRLWAVFWALIVTVVVGGLVTVAREPTINSLRGTIADHVHALARCEEQSRSAINQAQQDASNMAQGYFEILDYQLSILANHALDFGDTERISVYQHDQGEFRQIGRYSKNPDFQKRGRPTYPDDQGCIGAAWHDGEAIVSNLPDPRRSKVRYATRLLNDWGIPPEVSDNFRMRSRDLAAFAIEDTHGRRVAVIVFESTRTGVLSYDRIREVVNGTENRRLAAFIDKMKPFDAIPALAHRKGF